MTKFKLILALALLLSLATGLSIATVTLQNAATTTALQGSVIGGTKLYFEGLGFSSTMDQNLIYIGEFPCILEDGATATAMVCRTSQPDQYKEYVNLPIFIIVGNGDNFLGAVTATQTFSYVFGQTPYVNAVAPAVSYGGSGSMIYFLGAHRIIDLGEDKDMGDVYGIYIGDSLCSRFGISQDPITPNGAEYIQCYQATLQKAGKYQISLYLFPGRSASWELTYKATIDNNQLTQFVVLPLVNDTTHTGSINGQELTIKGTGFSLDKADVSVSVDGVNCAVSESSFTEVKCKLVPKTTQSAKLVTNATLANLTYNSGVGFLYQRYNTGSISLANFKLRLENGSLTQANVADEYISGQIKSDNVFGSTYGQLWKGYFTPTVTGGYKFRGMADDYFSVYLSPTFGSTVSFVGATAIAFSQVYQSNSLFPNYYLNDIPTAESAYIQMEAGKQYYMEVYHVNNGGSGRFSLSVEVPNNDTNVERWQTYEVHTFTTTTEEDPQIVDFTSTGPTTGTINLKVFERNPATLAVIVDQNVTVPFNATATQFCNELVKFSWFGAYGTTCTLTMKDSTGEIVTTSSLAKTFIWRASIARFRPANVKNRTFIITYTAPGGVFTSTTVQEHSPLISGTFTMDLGGNTIKIWNGTSFSITNIPFNVATSTLKSAFQQLNPAFKLMEIERAGDPNTGARWIIYYIGYNKDLPELSVVGMLAGGKAGKTPNISATTRRNYTSNLFVDPMDYRWMRTPSVKPGVIVSVNGIQSACNGDCSYTFLENLPIVTGVNLTGSTVNLNVSDLSLAINNLKELTVTVDGQNCVNFTGTTTNFNCKLPANTDATPILSAGAHLPVVNLASLGTLSYGPDVTAITANLVLTSVTSSSGLSNGGVQVTVVGKGFPRSSNDIVFNLCGKICSIKSLTNIQAKIIIPSCNVVGSTTISSSFKSFTANVAFTYLDINDALQINSLFPSSWSPVMKGVMNITGAGFGTDPTKLTVFLTNSSGNIYQMKVLSTTNNILKVGIPGGLPGYYDVTVIKEGFGSAIPLPASGNDFAYEVVITGVSPSSGSIGGGTLITISGKNFVPDALDTLVTIGNELNQICNIESITTTQIKCRTPPKNFYYNVSVPQVITVDSKLIMPTNCSGSQNCWFTYLSQDVSPMVINASSTTISTGMPLKVNGAKFDLSTQPKVSFNNRITGKVTVVTPLASASNSTVLSVTVPPIEAGLYAIRARTDPLGESNMTSLTISLNIDSVSVSGLSIFGGNIKILGSGFPSSWPNKHYNRMSLRTSGNNIPIKVVSMSPNQIVLTIPPGATGRTYEFSLTSPTGTTRSITFSQLTSGTPKISFIGTPSINPQVQTLIQLNQTVTALASVLPEVIQVFSVTNPNFFVTIPTNYTVNATLISFNVTLNTGRYAFKLFDDVSGWYDTTDIFLNVIRESASVYTLDQAITKTSFNGGTVKINGPNIGDGAIITVNGFKGPVVERTATYAVFKVPQLVAPKSQTDFKLIKEQKIDLSNMVKFGDSPNFLNAFDNAHSTTYLSTSASTCYVGVDIGQNLGVLITRIRYFPNPNWNIASMFLQGANIEVSNDNSIWSTIATVDQTVHAGWNSFIIKNTNLFRYVRLSHNNVSRCNISEFEINGIVMSTVEVISTDSLPSNITFEDGITTNLKLFENALEYTKNTTPIITGVTPDKGDVFGGYNITLTGVFLNLFDPTVVIDAIPCVVRTKTETQIICTVGSRLNLPQKVIFDVKIGGIPAVIQKRFRYVMRWSDPRTWGTDLPPIDDDLVHVPPGMHLLVDQTTPILEGIIVENGTIEFSNERDMVVSAEFITLRGGEFIAGTEEEDYDYKLTFVMYGNYYSPQQPMFGNKGIGCLECKFSMIGKKRTPTWTVLNTTVNPDENIITVKDPVDWKVGESIVIASTSYNHNEAQQRVIVNIINQTVITLDQPLMYKHYAGTQNHGSDVLEMRAEVGLLTRNIVMMGDETSVATDYGSHLMLTGSAENGLVGKIAYTEFTKCGQPQIMGRYCHHFHMAGDVPDSYSIGNSVHHSMARILTLHGVHFLYVAWNVGYRVKGHNFFIEDGIETNNVLEYNLAISSLLVNNMMQTDMSVASFWITNPTNHLRFNRAAGSDFYGFWYEIKERPDGPSATEDVCPIGNPLGESHDNVAHSNVRFGLRIFKLYSRTNPCQEIRNDMLPDPWSANPSVESRFYNYQLWKNGEAGLLAEETGNMVFQNFIIAESKMAGMEFYKTNFTKERVIARNITIIGVSSRNPPDLVSELDGSKGAILSRTGEQTLDNIRFYNFPAGMTVWQACSKCNQIKLYTNTGAQYFASNISYTNINGPYYLMMGEMKRDVFYDVDGTLTKTYFDGKARGSATMTNGWPHLLQDPECLSATNASLWDSAAVCNGTSTVRQVMFTNLIKHPQFLGQKMRVRMITGVQDATNATVFTDILSLQKAKEPKIEKKFAYSLPYLTNRTYEVWWGTRIDFTSLSMITTHHYKETDLGIVFKFKYIDNRELYQIAPLRQGKPFNTTLLKLPSSNYLDRVSCGNGDYYHNNADDIRVLHLCASGKNRSFFEYVNVNAIYCRNICPAPPGSCTKQSTLRYWSNPANWPGSALPKAGDNIIIPCEWTIIMDMNPVRMGYFEISGGVILQNTTNFDVTIEAENIWIKGGSLKAGTSANPFPKKLTIRLLGAQNATGFTVSPQLTGNKMFVNTGRLQLFGTPPTTIWTRLTSFANKGATTLRVASTSGWKVGDQLGIAPSFSAFNQYEKVTITAVNSATNVSITPALQFAHFGDTNPTIVKSYGTMDMRTGVAHLTRNIKIEAGNDTNWGFTLIQYGYSQQLGNETVISTGKMTLSGVEFDKGGQMDTEEAALQIFNIRAKTERTTITKSSFHDCQDYCMHLLNIFDVEITNNVFFSARKYHVLALQTFSFTFTNNLMIGVIKRPSITFDELVACYASYEAVNPKEDNIKVTNNLCQGSQGLGYAVPDVECSDIDIYPFANNTAGSCSIGWIFARGEGTCLAARGIYAYACTIGHIMNPPGAVTTKLKHFILADNGRGLTFRIGGGSDDKTAFLHDSYITAMARPNCTQCYGTTATDCIGNHGVRMLTTGKNGELLPKKFSHSFDVVCKEQTIDGKVFIYNVEFNNFKQTYSNMAQCSGNVIFRPHSGGMDITASHHLFNTTCTDCQLGAFAYFQPPNPNLLGWFGGCGDILCTGMNNYFIQDHSGTLLPQKGILLANNSWIGDNTPSCTKIPSINGHYCADEDFGVIEYESVAPDFDTRIMWPVYLFFDGGNWTSQTNGWAEWQWNGGQPLNRRLARFVSVLKLHKMYNMTFKSMPPEDMTFKFQRRLPEGNASDWVIVKLYYPKPNSIRVEVGGKTIKPISLMESNGQEPLNTSVCGSNKFFYKNYTVHFVITGDPNCLVRVSLTNSIQLTARFEMNINDFFRDDGVTRFINRMAALLRINDTSRIKVVGIYQGSVEVVTYIEPVSVPLTSSTVDQNSAQTAAVAEIKAVVSDVINNGELAAAMQSEGLGNMLQVSATIINFVPIIVNPTNNNGSVITPENPVPIVDPTNPIDPTNPTNPTNPDQPYIGEDAEQAQKRTTKIIVGVVVGGTCAVCLAVVSTIFYMRKKVKIGQITSEELQQMESDSQQWSGAQNNEKVMFQQNQSIHNFGGGNKAY